jgi:hypothetical protein
MPASISCWYPGDTDKIYPSLQCALDALTEGRLDREILEQSASRPDKVETEQLRH